ncbi:MAG: hypothetical protein IKK66_02885 [Ruminococcus sp.]|nr:hypothetical protein [Ruminococcus sp.]
MRSTGSYISSFIVTLLLVFTLIASAGCITADKFATKENLINLTEEKDISSIVHKELNKYFTEKYAETGIPADVYMKHISVDYLQSVVNDKIDYGFTALNGGDTSGFAEIPQNTDLDESIKAYFEEYAKTTGYEIKDENDKYYTKLANVNKKAYSAIEEYCDVYKFNALVKHGIIKKVKPLYAKLPIIKIVCLGASAFLALVLLICNFKRIKDALYWIGTAAVSAGILGCIPCIYLLNTDYFAAFSIKQAQIYTSYTTAMKTFTEDFLTACIILVIAALILYVLYGIFSALCGKSRINDKTSEKNNSSEKTNINN